MIIYKDAISGDELFSDTYKMTVVDDIFYEVEGKMVTEKTVVDDAMFGGNASAEGGADQAADDVSTSGCNIAIANRLVEVPFSKSAFKDYISGYMKKLAAFIKENNPSREAEFKVQAKAALTKIVKSFDDWQFFFGESGVDKEGMVILMGFREDGLTPFMRFFKDGITEEKV